MDNSVTKQPRVYYCRHMQPGTAFYDDTKEMILVDTDGMKALLNSLNGTSIPVYLWHQDVDLKTMKEKAGGYVTESFYNALDGWGWFKFLAVDDEIHNAIDRGWSVSNAYMPTNFGGAGTKNNVPYKREVKNGTFTHLAIVPNPRYEGAKIFTPEQFAKYQDELRAKIGEVKNSKQKGNFMFKLFNLKKEEATTVTEDTVVELQNGKTITVKEMVNSVTAEMDRVESEKSQIVEVNGEKVPLSKLIGLYEKIENAKKKMKKNNDETEAAGEEEKEVKTEESGKDKKNKKEKKNMGKDGKEMDDCYNSEDEDEAEEDEDKEAKEKKNKKEKKNSTHEITIEKSEEFFNEMRNAHVKRQEEAPVRLISTTSDQLARGKARYGSDPVKK